MGENQEITKEQIDIWKAKFEKEGLSLHKIKLETGEECIVRSPRMKEIEAVQPLLQQGKFMTYNASLFRTCFLGGANLEGNEKKLYAAAGQMMATVEVITSTVEKL